MAFLHDPCVIKKILRHLGLWDIPIRPPPVRCNTGEQPELTRPWPDNEPDQLHLWPDTESTDPWLDSWPTADPVWED